MKIKFFLMALVAIGFAGCKSSDQSNQYSGAPSPGYDTEMGEGRSPLIESNQAPNYPQGPYYLWRYRGITPTTP